VLTREAALEVVRQRRDEARVLVPALVAMLDEEQPRYHSGRWVAPQGIAIEHKDRTEIVRGKAARAILAIAAPDDPSVARARAVLAQLDEKSPAGK